MLKALFLSIAQLTDRPVAMVLVKSLAITVLILAALGGAVAFGMHWLAADGLGAGPMASEIAGALALAAAVAAGWLAFRLIAIAVIGVFADDVVAAVEARHYPESSAQVRPVPFARATAMGLRSIGRSLLANLLLMPLYLGLLVTGIGAVIVFFLVNSWLLGRDLGDMVAVRHMDDTALREWRRRSRIDRFAVGAAATGLLLVPVINLVAPVIGAAMATHALHRRELI